MAFKITSPLPCWKGYERVPGTKPGKVKELDRLQLM